MKILLAVDGSKSAVAAVAYAATYASQLRERPEVELLFAHAPIWPMGMPQDISITEETLQRYYQQQGEVISAEARKILAARGISFRTHTVVGQPAESICDFAAAQGCDLIIMGTRGMGKVANLFLGSTATKVLHLAQVPVLLVPAHREPAEPLNLQTMRT